MKGIEAGQFNDLKKIGGAVLRHRGGDVITFAIGKEYILENKETKETIKVRCTQDCPHHVKVIN